MTSDQRDDLLARNDDEYRQLKELVERVREAGRIDEVFAGETRERSIRDVLAHLLAWHLLLEGWYEDGMIGGSPAIPADGYTWHELDALNLVLRDQWQDLRLGDVERRLDASHAGLQRLVATHTDEELFNGTTYPWTRGYRLGEFCLECGGNHYRWAREAILAGLPDLEP